MYIFHQGSRKACWCCFCAKKEYVSGSDFLGHSDVWTFEKCQVFNLVCIWFRLKSGSPLGGYVAVITRYCKPLSTQALKPLNPQVPTPKGADLASPACMALVVFLPRPESQYIIWVPRNKNRNKSSWIPEVAMVDFTPNRRQWLHQSEIPNALTGWNGCLSHNDFKVRTMSGFFKKRVEVGTLYIL